MKTEVMSKIVDEICCIFLITREQFFSRESKRDLVDARYFFYYACIDRGIRNFFIQKFLLANGRYAAHSTISHGVSEMRERFKTDDDYASMLNRIQSKITI